MIYIFIMISDIKVIGKIPRISNTPIYIIDVNHISRIPKNHGNVREGLEGNGNVIWNVIDILAYLCFVGNSVQPIKSSKSMLSDNLLCAS